MRYHFRNLTAEIAAALKIVTVQNMILRSYQHI